MNILKSEKLKLKNSKILIFCIIIPIICGLFSIFFGGTYNAINQTIYWWMSCFSLFLMQLIINLNLIIEKKANNYFNIKSTNIKKSKIILNKILLTIYYTFISNIIILTILFLFLWSMPENKMINNQFIIIKGILFIFLNNLWIIPFFILLQKKINKIMIIISNFIISLIIAPFIASSNFFILFPYSYSYKVGKYFFYIKESGDILNRQITIIDKIELNISTLLSLIIFLTLTYILYKKNNID